MNQTKHTPGPWGFTWRLRDSYVIGYPECDIVVAHVLGNVGQPVKANARLIAESPRMLDELKIMHDWLADQLGEWLPVDSSQYPNQQLVEMKEHYYHLQAAIAKAVGTNMASPEGKE